MDCSFPVPVMGLGALSALLADVVSETRRNRIATLHWRISE
jgi:hypothetical protein